MGYDLDLTFGHILDYSTALVLDNTPSYTSQLTRYQITSCSFDPHDHNTAKKVFTCFLTVAIWPYIQPLPNYATPWFLHQSRGFSSGLPHVLPKMPLRFPHSVFDLAAHPLPIHLHGKSQRRNR